MNDTEKIEELMTELDNIDKENQEGDVPVITKEYNIGDEEPTTEQEKTKIMEEIQENIEQTPEEEGKDEKPELTPLPDKEKKNKKLMIILIVATVALLIAIILLSIFVKPEDKKEKPKQTVKDDVISYEEYKKIITAYGDSVTKAYKELKQKNKNITNVTTEDLDIDYKDHEVTCKEMHFNYDKTVFLDDCKIKGYESQYNFHYGEKETEDNKYKVYIYKIGDVYGYDFDKDRIDNYNSNERNKDKMEIIKTLPCKDNKCEISIPSSSNKNAQHFIMYNNNAYYLYSFNNESKKELKELSKLSLRFGDFIYTDKGTLKLIYLYDKETEKIGIYNAIKDKIIAECIYRIDITTDYMKKAGYRALVKASDDNFNEELYIINESTGDLVKKIKAAGRVHNIYDQDLDGKHYYMLSDDQNTDYYKDNFEKVPNKTQEEDTNMDWLLQYANTEDGDENEE